MRAVLHFPVFQPDHRDAIGTGYFLVQDVTKTELDGITAPCNQHVRHGILAGPWCAGESYQPRLRCIGFFNGRDRGVCLYWRTSNIQIIRQPCQHRFRMTVGFHGSRRRFQIFQGGHPQGFVGDGISQGTFHHPDFTGIAGPVIQHGGYGQIQNKLHPFAGNGARDGVPIRFMHGGHRRFMNHGFGMVPIFLEQLRYGGGPHGEIEDVSLFQESCQIHRAGNDIDTDTNAVEITQIVHAGQIGFAGTLRILVRQYASRRRPLHCRIIG